MGVTGRLRRRLFRVDRSPLPQSVTPRQQEAEECDD